VLFIFSRGLRQQKYDFVGEKNSKVCFLPIVAKRKSKYKKITKMREKRDITAFISGQRRHAV